MEQFGTFLPLILIFLVFWILLIRPQQKKMKLHREMIKNLKGYDQTRLYAYLAERYLSFWFNKYTKVKKANWTFFDVNIN